MKHLMRIAAVLSFVGLFMACQSGTNNATMTDENTPGPVSEADQSRYNLNASDKALYGTTDTLNQDSLSTLDSLSRDSL
ncbi:hypothetical protein [Sphingobacterium wenxiniae]|uniref:Uncharacterized protein n=1 Tax=Sphingobacterium wenxiniae TaxID=683125 RepID=A0A1I6PBJ2_9SPHI|nr:hypothetical protein [Sphingobacterium wenxiniae]SFS37505.1 hypothetical protein SAMN05660206_101378 [Sphingobacterium wenxiniae]